MKLSNNALTIKMPTHHEIKKNGYEYHYRMMQGTHQHILFIKKHFCCSQLLLTTTHRVSIHIIKNALRMCLEIEKLIYN